MIEGASLALRLDTRTTEGSQREVLGTHREVCCPSSQRENQRRLCRCPVARARLSAAPRARRRRCNGCARASPFLASPPHPHPCCGLADSRHASLGTFSRHRPRRRARPRHRCRCPCGGSVFSAGRASFPPPASSFCCCCFCGPQRRRRREGRGGASHGHVGGRGAHVRPRRGGRQAVALPRTPGDGARPHGPLWLLLGPTWAPPARDEAGPPAPPPSSSSPSRSSVATSGNPSPGSALAVCAVSAL